MAVCGGQRELGFTIGSGRKIGTKLLEIDVKNSWLIFSRTSPYRNCSKTYLERLIVGFSGQYAIWGCFFGGRNRFLLSFRGFLGEHGGFLGVPFGFFLEVKGFFVLHFFLMQVPSGFSYWFDIPRKCISETTTTINKGSNTALGDLTH